MKWITRSHVQVDRVACPWLVSLLVGLLRQGLRRRETPCIVSTYLLEERTRPSARSQKQGCGQCWPSRNRLRRWKQRQSVRSNAAKQSAVGRTDGASVS